LRKAEAVPSIFRRGHLIEASLCFRSIAIGSSQVFLTRLDSILLVSRIGAQACVWFLDLVFILNQHQLIQDQHEQLRASSRLQTEVISRKRRMVSDDLVEDDHDTASKRARDE
jgi:hypothetical protein